MELGIVDTKRMQSYRLSEQTIEAIDALATELGVSKAEAITRAIAALGAARRCGEHLAYLAGGALEVRARKQEILDRHRSDWDHDAVMHTQGLIEGDDGMWFAYRDAADLLAELLLPYIGKGAITWSDCDFLSPRTHQGQHVGEAE